MIVTIIIFDNFLLYYDCLPSKEVEFK